MASDNQTRFFTEKITESITKKIGPLLIDTFEKEIKNIDLSQSPQIIELYNRASQQTDDINKNYSSIINLRDIILSNETDKRIILLNEQVAKHDEEISKNQQKIYEIMKNIEGSDDEDDGGLQKNGKSNQTVKERLDLCTNNCISLKEKVEAIDKRNNSMKKEFKEDIRLNLKNETFKVVETFKNKLESFTNKFEHELKNKIDQMGLATFENKMNSKLSIDLKDKLNRNELKKNNNLINRKIDSLENKISKTLVDTIIDLQMEEAPLLTKKNSRNVEICASCNQVLKTCNSISGHERSNTGINSSGGGAHSFRKTIYGSGFTQSQMPKINIMSPKKSFPELNKYS